jgi:hypothetical protein
MRSEAFRPWLRAGVRVVGGLAAFITLTSVALASPSTSAIRSRTLYAVVAKAQFVNTSDGVTRGDLTNPFNADSRIPPKPNGKGPLPGDTAFYAFKLYASANLRTSVGSGTYTCTYSFHDRGICEGYFDLDNGTMFASGAVNFTTMGLTLAITGGTSAYIGASGEVVAAPLSGGSNANESRLNFELET